VSAIPEPKDAEDIVAILGVERIADDVYRADHLAQEDRPLYGGQVAGQALAAAGATVPAERVPHSLHGYFLRPGDSNRPTVFRVERDRDGRSVSARRVVAIQSGDVIFNMAASFQQSRVGPEVRITAMPAVARPPELPAHTFVRQPVFDVRVITAGSEIAPFPTRFWARCRSDLPAEHLLHACVLTYLSDASTGLVHHFGAGWSPAASLDHALWLHRPVALDDWVLVDLVGRAMSGSRGLYTGSVFAGDGALTATFVQEMIFRRTGVSG
jgi:acyl-CoA thioesterase-2